MANLLLLILTFSAATLSWEGPSANTDGSPITDLAGYKIYYGTSSGNYSEHIDVGNVKNYTIDNLVEGLTYYFAVTAYDTSGNESDFSNEVSLVKYRLKVDVSGTGEVVSSPEGISCRPNCEGVYKPGTVITLIATPQEGSRFIGWSGGECGGNSQCVLTINENLTVSANFKSLPKEQSTVFTVQVAAFRNALYANYFRHYFNERGYDTYVVASVSPYGEKLYKVCIGKFNSFKEAKYVANRIRRFGVFKPFVTTFK
ncbi:MAG: InlB B-repeat-containing protein [Thermodesulfovibrionales bacterium]